MLACSATSTNRPSFEVTPSGNAWIITIPKGSSILVKDKSILLPATYEIDSNGIFTEKCKLVSEAYFIERDERELNLLQTIEILKIKKDIP